MVSIIILYIIFLFEKCFPILKLKNVKTVCPKRIIKGQKKKKDQKSKTYEPHKRDKNRS